MVCDVHSIRLAHNWIQRVRASRELMVSVNSLMVSVICMLVVTLFLVLHIKHANNSAIAQLMDVNVLVYHSVQNTQYLMHANKDLMASVFGGLLKVCVSDSYPAMISHT